MSAVADGPETNVVGKWAVAASALKASGTVATTLLEFTMQM